MPGARPDQLRTADVRVVAPRNTVTRLGGYRPFCKTVLTGAANSDNVFSLPLGYGVKSLTLTTPAMNAVKQNTDSVYVDLEDYQGATAANGGPVELPPAFSLTWEEVDPGWFHFGSPTANQVLIVTCGGPSHGAP